MKISLKYKAAILVATTELLLLGLLLFFNLHSSRETLEAQLRNQARASAELVAASATGSLLALDLAQLQNQLDSVIGKYNISFVSISDHRGRVLAKAGDPLSSVEAVHAQHKISIADSLFGEVNLTISRAQAELALRQTTQSNMMIVALEIALVAILSMTLGWILTRNLTALIEGTKSIEKGDYSVRIPVKSKDETGVLARHFNFMAARLSESMEELETGRQRFVDMAENTSDWLWETDAEDRYTFCSGRIENILGFAPQQMVGSGFFEFMLPADAKRLYILLNEAREEKSSFYGFEYKAMRKDGVVVDLETNGVPVIDRKGQLTGFRGVTRDITRRKEDASRLVYLSEHDPLTGLLSRHKFLEILEDEVEFSELTNTPTTLLYIDLDGFKLLNDTHGHMVGDALLKLVAELLVNESSSTAQIARLGGDEFGILLRGVESPNGKKLAKRILASIDSAPLAINNNPIHITAGIGICTSPHDGITGETLIAHADAALNHAKAMGHNRYYIYQGSDRDIDTMRDTVNWRSVIHSAMEENRLSIEYQPIVSTAVDTQYEKYEALVRILDQDGESIPAGKFIRTAEHTGQVSEIDKWVLKTVIRTINESPNSNLCIAVNISGKSLETPGFCEYCQKLAFDSAIKPQQLIFEITETTAIAEMARAENFMTIMKRLGYRFSLDDFGVGFSSFSYLKHLPVDQIKIDGSFIRHLETSREDQIFVDAIVRVAKGLGLESVAEFVENETTFRMLAKMGVDNVQGHYIGMADKVLKWPDIKRLSEAHNRRREN